MSEVRNGRQHETSLPSAWRLVELDKVTQINPRRSELQRKDDALTSFVQMSAIDDQTGAIVAMESKPYAEVKKGYTYFGENDVLFAKITPCMQNGKHAIAHGLVDGIGFGTTELHVLRPGNQIISEWIHYFVRQPEILNAATNHFTGAVGQQRVPSGYLASLTIPLPPLSEQKRIAGILKEQLAAVERARAAAEQQLDAARKLAIALVRESQKQSKTTTLLMQDCADEVKTGIGESWKEYPVLGATRDGLAPAKENVGKNPERYKPVIPGTIFYNPMRIMIGSIAMLDEGQPSGITSPDYVVIRPKEGVLHSKWFYTWFRSSYGEEFIKSLARGAVRERMLFTRLAQGEIELPPWQAQVKVAKKIAVLDQLGMRVGKQLDTLQYMPNSLLRAAFQGHL